MQIHKGKAGGPDVSNATTTGEVFTQDSSGLMKCTCTGRPGETKVLLNTWTGYKFIGLSQTQRTNAVFGWSDESGRMKAGATGHGQQKVSNFDASLDKPDNFPTFQEDGYVVLSIGADGNPATYTFELGPKL